MDRRNPHYYMDPATQDMKPAFTFPPQLIALRTENPDSQSPSIFLASQHVLERESELFADMFAMPQPTDIETYEGHPLISVQDHPHELQLFLECLHDHRRFFLNDASKSYSSVAALLRLSNKYQVSHLREQMTKALMSHYPAPWETQDEDESTGWGWPDNTTVPKLSEVATLAQETRLVDLHAILFYHMLIAELQTPDGFLLQSPPLPMDQIRSLQQGKREIQHRTLTLILDVAGQNEDSGSALFCPYKACDKHRRSWMNNVVQRRLYMEPRCVASVPFPTELCGRCMGSMIDLYTQGCEGVWKDLPAMFDLDHWEDFNELHRTSSDESG